jgi:transposase-like protein
MIAVIELAIANKQSLARKWARELESGHSPNVLAAQKAVVALADEMRELREELERLRGKMEVQYPHL